MRVRVKIKLVAFSVVGWKAFIDWKFATFADLHNVKYSCQRIVMTFSIFFKPHTSVVFPHSRRSWPDEYSDKTIVNRPTFKAIYREFDIALFFCFFFTSHCDWFRKHESRMAFLHQEPRKKANCVCSTINSRVLLMFSLFCHGPLLIFTTPLPALSKNYELC